MAAGSDKAASNTPDRPAVTSTGHAPTKRGMVLPFQPLSLAFNHVNYYVDMPAVSCFSESLSLSSSCSSQCNKRNLRIVVGM